jgi:hypothetical protein
MVVEDYGDYDGNEGFGIMVVVMSVMGGRRRLEYGYNNNNTVLLFFFFGEKFVCVRVLRVCVSPLFCVKKSVIYK